MIRLDANFLICAAEKHSPESERVKEWLRGGETLCISTIAWAEYLCGKPLAEPDPPFAKRIVTRQVDFTDEMAALSARLFNKTGRHRRMFVDCMIAATAIAEQARIATANLKDFRKFEPFGLNLMPPATY